MSAMLAMVVANGRGYAFEIDLPASAIAYSAQTSKLYAAIAGSAGPVLGAHLIEISPTDGTITGSVPLGGNPGPLAISPDAPTAYVGLAGTTMVLPVDLASMTAGTAFETSGYVAYIAVMPEAPTTIAVSTGAGEGTVAVYDNGVMRGGHDGTVYGANSIGFDSQSKLLFGYNNYDTNSTLTKSEVGPAGVTLVHAVYNVIQGFYAGIVVDNGIIYSSTGATVDGAQLELIGTYQSNGPVVVDVSNQSIIFAHANALDVFDRDTFVPTFSLAIANAQGKAISAAGCGSACVGVVYDSGQIFVLQQVRDRIFAGTFE